jgi:hypothetical protein
MRTACVVCGKALKRAPSSIRHPQRIFCSLACQKQLSPPGRKRTGKRQQKDNGYIAIYIPEHPNAGKDKRVYEHHLIAEHALGRVLPPKAVVHHSNEEKADNRSSNLVLCEDERYHRLLHYRKKAYAATGNANAKRCWICKTWALPDAPDLLRRTRGRWGTESIEHRHCVQQYRRTCRQRRLGDATGGREVPA